MRIKLKNRNKRVFAGLAAMLLAISLVSGTLAYWIAEEPAVHIINTGTLKGEVVEEYEEPKSLLPGAEVVKVASVKNVGELDLLARVQITKVWGSEKGADGKVIADPGLSTDNILLQLNLTDWEEIDGWYYYKGILAPGESTPPLLRSFTLAAETEREYANKLADIIVYSEYLQAGGGALESEWGVSYTQISVAQPQAPAGGQTKVYFIDPETEFTFEPATTDLFANFKELIPGETRVQEISVQNKWTETVEIYLKADFVEQDLATPENIALANRMLQEYAQVTISRGTTLVYAGGIWGNYPSEATGANSMRAYISLGNFAAGESKELTVTLTLSADLDNTYQNLWGKIKWWFLAYDDTPDETPAPGCTATPTPGSSGGTNPKTGDSAKTLYYISGICLAGTVCTALLALPRRKKRSWE